MKQRIIGPDFGRKWDSEVKGMQEIGSAWKSGKGGHGDKEGMTNAGEKLSKGRWQPEEPIPSRPTQKTTFDIFINDHKNRKKCVQGVLLVKFQLMAPIEGDTWTVWNLRIGIKHSGSHSEDLGCVGRVNWFKMMEGESSVQPWGDPRRCPGISPTWDVGYSSDPGKMSCPRAGQIPGTWGIESTKISAEKISADI